VSDVGDWTSQLRRGVLELAILRRLEREPSYGYAVATHLASVPQLAAGEGTVYPLLRRLRKDGILETYWQESAEGPPRQYYRLTTAGRRRLRTIEEEWRQVVAGVERLLEREKDR
jgi:PadR family transcriptional regulator PadR